MLQNKDNNNIIYMIFRRNRFTLVTPYIHHSKTGRPRRLYCWSRWLSLKLVGNKLHPTPVNESSTACRRSSCVVFMLCCSGTQQYRPFGEISIVQKCGQNNWLCRESCQWKFYFLSTMCTMFKNTFFSFSRKFHSCYRNTFSVRYFCLFLCLIFLNLQYLINIK